MTGACAAGAAAVVEQAADHFTAQIAQSEFPLNALDLLIDSLGGERQVAEMTGRTSRKLRNDDGDVTTEVRVRRT